MDSKRVIIIYSLSAFLFYSLFLALPSGYSYGAILCFLSGLAFVRKPLFHRIGILVSIYLVFCGLFFINWEIQFIQGTDYELLLKYCVTAILCVVLIGRFFSVRFLVYGMCIGACICICISFYQLCTLGRAQGFTNAIRYGNLSALISIWLLLFGFLKCFSIKEKFFIFSCSLMAMGSSLASLSRGGWLLYLVAVSIALVLLSKMLSGKRKLIIQLVCVSLLLIFFSSSQRIQVAVKEAIDYFSQSEGGASTSVGARLEMYRFAINAGLEKPLVGWGDKSIRDELRLRIENKEYDEYLLTQPHLHNEFLDTFSRRGIIGVFGLILIYMTPIFLIKRFNVSSRENLDLNLINMAIVLLPLAYFIFGITDLFFHMNISHMFYAFSILFLFAACANYSGDK